MLVIGNKKYRNLQEQVGWNTEQIDKIFEFLDGLEVEDNLIKLENASGTLTSEEMEIVSRDVAFIIYNDALYVKTTTTASEFIFKQITLNASDNGSYNILQSFRITITRASGAYAYGANTVLTLYNKSELDALLSAKADLSGASFTGAVSASTLNQTLPNWSVDVSNIDLGYDTSIYSITGKYAKFEVINNVLYFVLSFGITNISGSNQNFNPNFIKYVDLRSMPRSIAEKIIDSKGNDMTAVDSHGAITAMHGFATYGIGTGEVRADKLIALGLMNWEGINGGSSMQLRVSSDSTISLADGASTAISFRTFLTLL